MQDYCIELFFERENSRTVLVRPGLTHLGSIWQCDIIIGNYVSTEGNWNKSYYTVTRLVSVEAQVFNNTDFVQNPKNGDL